MNDPRPNAALAGAAILSPAAIEEGRRELSIALRGAAMFRLNEGVCNHFSLDLGGDRYLINPQGLHWSEVQPEDILLIVEPVLMAPLRRRWDEVKAEAEVKAQKRALILNKDFRIALSLAIGSVVALIILGSKGGSPKANGQPYYRESR